MEFMDHGPTSMDGWTMVFFDHRASALCFDNALTGLRKAKGQNPTLSETAKSPHWTLTLHKNDTLFLLRIKAHLLINTITQCTQLMYAVRAS